MEHRDKAGKARKARKGRAEGRGKVSLRYQVSGKINTEAETLVIVICYPG
jgi:hypothetical protein